MRDGILQIGSFPDIAQTLIDERFDCWHADRLSPDDPRMAQVRGIITRSNHAVPERLIESLPALRIIATCGVGYDGIPVEFARQRGVVVTNTPKVLDAAVAELAIGLMLCALRQLPAAERHLRDGRWRTQAYPLTVSLAGKRVGIAGMGRIGEEIARRLLPFDVELAYFSRRRREELPWRFVPELERLAHEVDILLLAIPGGPATAKMVDARVLTALGPEGYLINIARGSVVDEDALIEALERRTIGGAALDVFDAKPDIDPRFARLENVVLTPHVGSATRETRLAMARLTLDNLESFFRTGEPLTPVN
jgi:lactate dehydrogenase-like 2-hydroxyacid dehydrogenase